MSQSSSPCEDDLAKLRAEAKSLAAEYPRLPTVFLYRRSSMLGTDDVFALPFQKNNRGKKATIHFPGERGGTLSNFSRSAFDACGIWFVTSLSVKISKGDQSEWLGVQVAERDDVAEAKTAWKQWAKWSAGLATSVWTFDALNYGNFADSKKAALAFVIRSAIGTPFISGKDKYLTITNLWGATLHSLANPHQVRFPDVSAKPVKPKTNKGGRKSLSPEEQNERFSLMEKASSFATPKEAAERLAGRLARPQGELYEELKMIRSWLSKNPAMMDRLWDRLRTKKINVKMKFPHSSLENS